MSRSVRSALDRCRQRADYCRREFERFCSSADLGSTVAARTHSKLKADWDRANGIGS